MNNHDIISSTKTISKIGLVCVIFGREINKKDSFGLMDLAIVFGVTFFDTAAVYGNGASERIIGEWFSTHPRAIDSTIISTKIRPPYTSSAIKMSVGRGLKRFYGWFYGLKLHLIINEQGALMALWVSSGNMSDNNPGVLQWLSHNLGEGGKIFGDAGYVSARLFNLLWEQALQLITKIRKNMKNKFIRLEDKYLLKKRTIVEKVIDLLKDWMNLWHTRHRSVNNGFNNLLACLAAYNFLDHKPSIKFSKRNLMLELTKISSN